MTTSTAVVAPPKWRTPVDQEDIDRGDGFIVASFIERLCPATRDTIAGPAGSPMVLLEYQHELLGRTYARRPDGRYRHRLVLRGVPRKNGKSGLASGETLYALTNETYGSEVVSAAADKQQAKIILNEAKRMVEQSPQLDARLVVYRDAIEDPVTNSVYRAISSEAYTKEGMNITDCFVDELHALPTRELFDVLQSGQGNRRDPLFIVTTTAGLRTDQTGNESICYQLFNSMVEVAEGAVIDESFCGDWWADDGPIGDIEADMRANPAFDVLVAREDFEIVKKRTPSAEYYTKRRNLFVASASHWFNEGIFESLAAEVEVGDRPVVLGFDGSWNQDCTALVGCTADEAHHLFVVDVWQRPRDDEGWHVPTEEVLQAIHDACSTWNVVEIAADPALWKHELEELRGGKLPVIDFPQQGAPMVEATSSFQHAVIGETLTHDGDPRLELHVRNCHVEMVRGGVKVKKDTKMSSHKIDSAVAAIMARGRASFYAERPVPVRGVRIA